MTYHLVTVWRNRGRWYAGCHCGYRRSFDEARQAIRAKKRHLAEAVDAYGPQFLGGIDR